MKVYWNGCVKLDFYGQVWASTKNPEPSQKEYHLFTDEELEEIKKQAIADYEETMWMGVFDGTGELVMRRRTSNTEIDKNAEWFLMEEEKKRQALEAYKYKLEMAKLEETTSSVKKK